MALGFGWGFETPLLPREQDTGGIPPQQPARSWPATRTALCPPTESPGPKAGPAIVLPVP